MLVVVATLAVALAAQPTPAQADVARADVAPAEVVAPAVAPPVAAAVAPARSPRVFVAPLVGSTADPGTVDLVEDRVLVAARALADRFEIVGAADVRNILDVEASKQAMGCDSTSCANEIADALNAEQLLTGQLGRIGETWQLTITRTERATLRIVGRAVRQSRGATPEGLLDEIPGQVAEVFGVVEVAAPISLTLVGAGTAALGGLAVVAGGIVYGYSWSEYGSAQQALAQASPQVKVAEGHRDNGVAALPFAWIVGGAGVAVVLVGGALLAIDAMGEP